MNQIKIVIAAITCLLISIFSAQAQSQYTLTLWPVSSGGASSGGAFALLDNTGKVGIDAAPSTGGQYTVSDGMVAPAPEATTPAPNATTTPTATATTPTIEQTPTATPQAGQHIYLPAVQK